MKQQMTASVHRDRIVATALRIVDEHGVAGLSLRYLAEELGGDQPRVRLAVADSRQHRDQGLLLPQRVRTIEERTKLGGAEPRPRTRWYRDARAGNLASRRAVQLLQSDGGQR